MKNHIIPIIAVMGAFFILVAAPVFAQTGGTGSYGSSGAGTGSGSGSGDMGMSPGVLSSPDTRAPLDESVAPGSPEGISPREDMDGVYQREREGTFPGRGLGISPGMEPVPNERTRDIDRSQGYDTTPRARNPGYK